MKWTLRAIYIVFLVKFILALMPSFQVDMGAWLAWAERLSSLGMARFYSDSTWTQYTPGFLYWLWFVGKVGFIHPLAIKIPAILADIFVGCLLWKIVAKTNVKWANVVFFLYTLNPAIVFNSSVWGQIDGILTALLISATYFLVERKNYYVSAALAGMAFLLKPQAIAILPVFFLLLFVRGGLKQTLHSLLTMALVIVIGFYPFYPANPLLGLFDLIHKMGISYPYTSLFAFNIWSYVGMWIEDSRLWMGLSYFSWGTLLVGTVFLLMLYRFRHLLMDERETYLLFALSCFIFFLFPTRVHERYLFPVFAYLLAYTGMKQSMLLIWSVIVLSVAYGLNVYYPYSYYEPLTNPLKNVVIEQSIQQVILVIASLYLTLFFGLWLFPAREHSKQRVPILIRERKTKKHRRDKDQT
jgi:dolichyl-phosphate-mannose-protein mannosyltransferase